VKWKEVKLGYVGVLDSLRNATPQEILGVSKDASDGEIKAAYRKRMATIHPDRSDAFTRQTDTEIAKLVNAAYKSLLKGARKR
jgi:DnaJ-class molecular chaperone